MLVLHMLRVVIYHVIYHGILLQQKKNYFTMFRILQQFDEMWNSSITAIRYITSAQ